MQVVELIGWNRLRESGPGEPGLATHMLGPAQHPALFVVMKGACTIGEDRIPVASGYGVMVEVGDEVDLRATTPELEVFRVEFVDRP